MPRDDATIVDILKAARMAKSFVIGVGKESFLQDSKTQSAVLHQLLVLGEAVKRLSEEFRNQHPTTPWKQISGLRDVVIHQYDAVDLEEVWKTVTVDLPDLVGFLEKISPRPPDV
jgi:uncharacterized protein with HEPN domain